jgi:hypothetical protein
LIGCKSGYGNDKLPQGVRKHIFPKDDLKRQQWIKAIPRTNWTPAVNAVVCSLHFEDCDYKSQRSDKNSSRDRGELKYKRLKDDAVPRIFPGLPVYLSSSRPKERTASSTSAARRDRQAEAVEQVSIKTTF